MSKFNVGYYEFNKDGGLNFQLNRFYSSGILEYDELMEIGSKVTSFEKWIELFCELAEKSKAEGDILKTAICYRAAQFYTLSDAVDEDGKLLKKVLYEKCREAYDQYYSKKEELKYDRIPFEKAYLPVYYVKPEVESKSVIVIHGGYDSFVQEFFDVLLFFGEQGYEVYFFEGPGQGEVLNRCEVQMTHEWEHCTSAVLDYFDLKDVTLIGISLGGYLATRAAAFDKRIQRLVMYDLIYDFYGSLVAKMGKKKARMFDYLIKHPKNIAWKWLEKKFNEYYFLRWLLKQGYAIYENVHTPYEYFNCIKKYNTRELSPMITQDTLVLAGAADIYTIYYQEQLDALKNARSVTGRVFTKEENGDHHCQIGNMKLVLDTIQIWIEEKTNGQKSGT